MMVAIRIAATGLGLALCAVAFALAGIRAQGLATFVVTGGSMEPTIPKGSLIVDEPVTADALRLGDVVTFERYGETTTHRIIGIEGDGMSFTTKGDANEAPDPDRVGFPGRVGVVRLAIPLAGYAVAWIHYLWRPLTAAAAGLVFLTSLLLLLQRVARAARPFGWTVARARWR